MFERSAAAMASRSGPPRGTSGRASAASAPPRRLAHACIQQPDWCGQLHSAEGTSLAQLWPWLTAGLGVLMRAGRAAWVCVPTACPSPGANITKVAQQATYVAGQVQAVTLFVVVQLGGLGSRFSHVAHATEAPTVIHALTAHQLGRGVCVWGGQNKKEPSYSTVGSRSSRPVHRGRGLPPPCTAASGIRFPAGSDESA